MSSFLQSARFCFTSHRFPSPSPPSHGKREICITPVCYIACPAVTPSSSYHLLFHQWRRFAGHYHHRRRLSYPFLTPIKKPLPPRPPPHLPSFPVLSRALTIVVSPEAAVAINLPFPAPSASKRPLEWVPRISPLFSSSSRRGPTSYSAILVAHQRDRTLPLSLVHSKLPHTQYIKSWTQSTSIFIRKINLSKPTFKHKLNIYSKLCSIVREGGTRGPAASSSITDRRRELRMRAAGGFGARQRSSGWRGWLR
jgi:hypothetical protein